MTHPIFTLEINSLLQGQFVLQRKNIAFVFQVNCPGSFAYGIPVCNELYSQFNDSVGFIGISTAFEDFELNTEQNTHLLLEKGICVGETLKYVQNSTKINTYPEKLLFPVAFDQLQEPKDFLNEENIVTLLRNLDQYNLANDVVKLELKEQVKQYYSNQKFIASTFTINQLRGTPSFVIFDDSYTILQSYFGHQSFETLADCLV